MNRTPGPLRGLLYFTNEDGEKKAVDVASIKCFKEIAEHAEIVFWDASWDVTRETFDELTTAYEELVNPSKLVEG